MRLSNAPAVVLLSTFNIVNVIANPDALPDDDQDMLNLQARAPEPTAAPLLRHARDRIFARQTQNAQTCGFIERDPNDALYCNSGYGCAYFTGTGPQFFQCCATYSTGGIDFNTATCFENAYCSDYLSHNYTYTYATSYQTSGVGTEYCGSTAQYCGITILEASEEVVGYYTHYNCESVSGVTSIAYDVASGGGGGSSVPVTASPSPSPTNPITTPTTAPTTSTPSTTTTPTSTPTPTPTPPPSKKSNTGAIAGGVVGGVGAAAIIGGLIGWLMWKKRKERQEADVPEVSVMPSK